MDVLDALRSESSSADVHIDAYQSFTKNCSICTPHWPFITHQIFTESLRDAQGREMGQTGSEILKQHAAY